MDTEAREARRRLIVAGIAVVAMLAVTFGLLFAMRQPANGGRSESSPSDEPAASSTSAVVDGSVVDAETTVEGVDRGVYDMPSTGDPEDFAVAYVTALATWDATTQTLQDRRELLLAWTPPTGWWTDAESLLDDWLGTQETWDAARSAELTQSVVVNRVWIPAEVATWMRTKPDEWAGDNYVVGVNVNVTRLVRGIPGASQDVTTTVSVLIACPPDGTCVGLGPGRSVIKD